MPPFISLMFPSMIPATVPAESGRHEAPTTKRCGNCGAVNPAGASKCGGCSKSF